MPIGNRSRGDFLLDGKPFILFRPEGQGRSWERSGVPDSVGAAVSGRGFGDFPDEIEHAEVWADWSGGFGRAYRRVGDNSYHWGEGFDARTPKQLVHCQAPQLFASFISNWGVINHLIDTPEIATLPFAYASGLIMAVGSGFYGALFPSASSLHDLTMTTSADLGNLLYRPAIYGSYAYFGSATGSKFWRVGGDGAGQAATGNFGHAFAIAGNKLWRSHGVTPQKGFYLSHVADPAGVLTTANWAYTYNIGGFSNGIADLLSLEDQVFAGMPDGLYAGDSTGTFYNVLSDLARSPHPDNCRDLTIWNNMVIAPHIGGIYAYRNGVATEIGPQQLVGPQDDTRGSVGIGGAPREGPAYYGPPDAGDSPSPATSIPATNRGPLQGRVRAVRGYGRNLYAGFYTGSQSWLLAGQKRSGGVAWHTLQRLPHQTKVSRIHVDSITAGSAGTAIPNRIWLMTDGSIDTSGTAPTYFWPIPNMDGNPLAPSPAFSANYIGSARMDLGNSNWGVPGTPKVYRAFEVWADTLLSGYRYADIYYDIDNSGSFALLGRAQTAPKSTLYFSAGEGSYVTGQSIELSVRSFTASPALTPVYRGFVLRGALRPRSIEQITALTRIADDMRDRQGGVMRSGATQLAELRAMAAQTAPVELIDLSGASMYVSVLQPVEEREFYQDGENYPEIMAKIRMSVMTFS